MADKPYSLQSAEAKHAFLATALLRHYTDRYTHLGIKGQPDFTQGLGVYVCLSMLQRGSRLQQAALLVAIQESARQKLQTLIEQVEADPPSSPQQVQAIHHKALKLRQIAAEAGEAVKRL